MADKRTGDFAVLETASEEDLILVTSQGETYNLPVSVLKQLVSGIASAAAQSAANAVEAAEAAKSAAQASLARQPQLSDSKTWMVWNPVTGKYDDTGVRAEASTSWLYVEDIDSDGNLWMVIVDEDEDDGLRFAINDEGELEAIYEW